MAQESLTVKDGAGLLEQLQAIETEDGLKSWITINQDYMLAVAKYDISGVEVLDKYGANRSISTGTDPEDMWEFGGLYPDDGFGTAPIINFSTSDSGNTGQTFAILGQDVSGNEVEQDVTSDGQNIVALSTPLSRVYRMENNSDAGLEMAEDSIAYVHTSPTVTSGDPPDAAVRLIVTPENEQTLMCLYTIPVGFVGFILKGEMGLQYEGNAAALAEYANCRYMSRRYGKIWKNKKDLTLIVGGTSIYQDVRLIPDIVPSGTDIKLQVYEVSANGMGAFGTLLMLKFDEDMFSPALLAAIGQRGY